MLKAILPILAGVGLLYHGVVAADASMFRGLEPKKDYKMHKVRGYEIQPTPLWKEKCGAHRPCAVVLPDSYYRERDQQRHEPGLMIDHR